MGPVCRQWQETAPGPHHAPGSQEPGPLDMLLERDKQTLKTAFLFPDLKCEKKKKTKNLVPDFFKKEKKITYG